MFFHLTVVIRITIFQQPAFQTLKKLGLTPARGADKNDADTKATAANVQECSRKNALGLLLYNPP